MICPNCKEGLYVIDSRPIRSHAADEGDDAEQIPDFNFQMRRRGYCCLQCNHRYASFEVLNPMPYKIKAVSESKMKSILKG